MSCMYVVYVHMCALARRWCQVSCFVTLLYSLETVCHWLSLELGWWPEIPGILLSAPPPPQPPSPPHTALGYRPMCPTQLFMWVLGIWTQVLIRQQSLLHIILSPMLLSFPFHRVSEVGFICHVVYPFKAHNSTAFHIFAGLHHHRSPLSVLENSVTAKWNRDPLANSVQCPPPTSTLPSVYGFSHIVYVTCVTLVSGWLTWAWCFPTSPVCPMLSVYFYDTCFRSHFIISSADGQLGCVQFPTVVILLCQLFLFVFFFNAFKKKTNQTGSHSWDLKELSGEKWTQLVRVDGLELAPGSVWFLALLRQDLQVWLQLWVPLLRSVSTQGGSQPCSTPRFWIAWTSCSWASPELLQGCGTADSVSLVS